jgi:hypothetical protein
MRTPLFAPEGEGGSAPFRRAMIEELQQAGPHGSGLRAQRGARHDLEGGAARRAREAVARRPGAHRARRDARWPHEGDAGFALPARGYATMLIKRLFAPSWYSQPIAADDDRRPRAPSVGPRGRLDAGFGSDEE